MVLQDEFKHDKVPVQGTTWLRAIFHLLELLEDLSTDLEHAGRCLSYHGFSTSLLFFSLGCVSENDLLAKGVPYAHQGAKQTLLGCLALELAIHDEVDVVGCGDALSVDELPRFQLVHKGVLHQELERPHGQFRENGVAQPNVLQGQHALHVF